MRDRHHNCLSHPFLMNLRANLRVVLIGSVFRRIKLLKSYRDKIGGGFNEHPKEEQSEIHRIHREVSDLFNLISRSTCFCPLCQSYKKNMTFDSWNNSWYCIGCYEEYVL